MKNFHLLFGALVAVVGLALVPSSAFAGWYSPTSGTTVMLYDVDFYSGYVVAVGASGTIRLSLTSGDTWMGTTSGTTNALYGVDLESTYGLAVGYGGVILRSTNLGVTWSAVTSGTTASLYDVAMSPYGRAFAVGYGGVLLTSSDFGATWSTVASGTTNTLQAVDIMTTSRAYAVGSGGTILTWNGTTWSTLTSGTTETLYGVSIVSASEAWVAGSGGVVRKTTDASTWSSVTTISGQTLYGIDMDSSTAGSVMSKTSLYETTNGTTFATPSTGSWSGVSWIQNIDYGSTARFAVGGAGNIRRYDVASPTVGAVTPTSAEVGVPVTLTVSANDETWSIVRCDIEVLADDGSGVVLDGVDSEDDTWTASYTPTIAGTYTTSATCYDPAYNSTIGASATLTVTGIDTTDPEVGATLAAANGTVGTPVSFSFTATDNEELDFCYVIIQEGFGVEGFRAAVSAYATTEYATHVGDTWTATYTFTEAGNFTAYGHCYDVAGNSGSSSMDATLTIAEASEVVDLDDTAPTIGTPSPTTFTLGTSSTVSATVSDNVGIDSCELYIDAEDAGLMTISGGTARKSYTFSTNDWSNGDTAIVTVECADDAGNVESTSVTVTLAAATTDDEEEDIIVDTEEDVVIDEEEAETTVAEETTNTDGSADAGSLIKLACDDGADVNDPCKAVYFYSTFDGKRHAFPNEKVFFTWYANFDSVTVVDAEFLASMTLGSNITYRPGVWMVKFVTVNTVYAVTRGGVLRAIDSEATATALYGNNWNQHIHDISDAFFGNYEFGEDVEGEDDYDAQEEEDSITDIDTNLEW